MFENITRDDLFLLPNDDNHNCFGCSPHNSSGLKMEFYTNEKQDSVYSWLTIPDHVCGWGNLVHGGIVTTILDEAMGWASVIVLKKLILTKTMSVDFFKPIFVKQEICVVGNILEVVNNREVVVQAAIYDCNQKLSAKSSSTVSLFTIAGIKKMGIFEDRLLDGFESIISTLNSSRSE
jgi:acyl-coenzyme A thioesterase PaaI-like protein